MYTKKSCACEYRDMALTKSVLTDWAKAHPAETAFLEKYTICLLYTSPSPRDRTRSRMPSSA